jgi:hypothetical protein
MTASINLSASLAAIVGAAAISVLSAPAAAETVSFDYSALHEDNFPGGEFIAEFSNGAMYRSFCLELDQSLRVGDVFTYSYTIDTDGADSAGAPDPVSSATASIFVSWLRGGIANTAENASAVQNAIWALESELDPSTLEGMAEMLYNDAVASFSTTDNAITDNPAFGNLRVINPYRVIDGETFYYQSQIILIPLPASGGLALAGLAALGMRRRR